MSDLEHVRYAMGFRCPTQTFHAEAEMMLGVEIKSASRIVSWGGWPSDVRELLREWNRGLQPRPMKLSFYRRGLFQCADCKARCEPATSGAAYLNDEWLCDDCLIDRARQVLALGVNERGDE